MFWLTNNFCLKNKIQKSKPVKSSNRFTETEKYLTETELKNAREIESRIVIDDRRVRLIGVPFFGLVIPSATGLIDFDKLGKGEVISFYIYFVFIAWIVWEGNRYLRDRFYGVINNNGSSLPKYMMMIAINVFYTGPVSLILLFGWWWLCGIQYAGPDNVLMASLVIIVSVIFITNVYDKIHYGKQAEQQQVKFEQLQRAKLQAELEALKNQIDPHFMFNALNSLSYLIEDNPGKAQEYTENLAEVYRYILQSKDKDLVLLGEEIAFVKLYVSLLELRYEDAFKVNLYIDEKAMREYLLPPVSMMVALENAVKHNELSKSNTLMVEMNLTENRIKITNRLRARRQYRESTKTGLKNLDERFLKTLGQGIHVNSSGGYFMLEMPLFKLNKL